MGFDNECIINIQSLAGEYFCPVCRTLVYPNEALQSQCTHLYCKPCLTYIVGTSKACPYDGYLVTEADSKPLIESNKALAETIGKILVHCLFHRSGCSWQGPLSDCTSHCSGCAFGNSPVVCNRCGIQIVHRQVQEHAQICTGANPQAQHSIESLKDTATSGTVVSANSIQASNQPGTQTSQALVSQTTAAPAPSQDSNQQSNANSQVTTVASASATTAEQWYQQQYQHYYQQYPGYDPYQQSYQQYYPYQQQTTQQLQQHLPSALAHNQPQVYSQPPTTGQPQNQTPLQPQVQGQTQPQGQLQPIPQAQQQPQSQVQIPPQGQHQPYVQNQANPQQSHPTVLPHGQLQSQTQPTTHGQMPPQQQPYSQVQPQLQAHPFQPVPQQNLQAPQYQQTPQVHQAQPQMQPQPHPQPQLQAHPHPQPPLQTNTQPLTNQQLLHPPQPNNPHNQPPALHAVSGHHSYPAAQPHQQMLPGAPLHQSIHMHPPSGPPVQLHAQFPQQPLQTRPPQSNALIPNQQQPTLMQSQGQPPSIPPPHHHQMQQHGHLGHQRPAMQPMQPLQQYGQQQPFPSQASGPIQTHFPQQHPFAQQPMHSQPRPQGSAQSLQQNAAALPPPPPLHSGVQAHGFPPHQSQTYGSRPITSNHATQPFPHSAGALNVTSHPRPMHLASAQPPGHQFHESRANNQQQPSSGEQVSQSGIAVKHPFAEGNAAGQEVGSPSKKAAGKDGSGVVTDSSGVKTLESVTGEARVVEEHKTTNEGEDRGKQEEILNKDAGAELGAVKDGSSESSIKKVVKEEGANGDLDSSAADKAVEIPIKDEKDAPATKQVEYSSMEDTSLQGKEAHGHRQDATNVGAQEIKMSQGLLAPLGSGVDEYGVFPDKGLLNSSHLEQGRHHPPLMPYGPSSHQPRAVGPSILQLGHPSGAPLNSLVPGHGPPHLMPQGPAHMLPQRQAFNPHENFQQSGAHDVPFGGGPPPGLTASYGRGTGQLGHPQGSFDLHSGAPRGHYYQNNSPHPQAGFTRTSMGESAGPPLVSGPPGSFEQHGGFMGIASMQGSDGPQRPTNTIETDMFHNQRPHHFEGRYPDSHLSGSLERGQSGQPLAKDSNMPPMNNVLGPDAAPGHRGERFSNNSDDHRSTFLTGSNRRFDQGEYDEAPKHFPKPSHMGMGTERSPKFGNGLSSSRSEFSHEFNYDAGSKPEYAGSAPSRFFPPYHSSGTFHPNDGGGRPPPIGFHEDFRGRGDSTRIQPDLHGSGPGFGVDHLTPRSPGSEYLARGYGVLSGGLRNQSGIDDFDGRDTRKVGEGSRSFNNLPLDQVGNSFREHFRNGEMMGQDFMPNHLRRGEFFGPGNVPSHMHMGDGFSAFSDPHMGEFSGPGGFPLSEPFSGSRSNHPRPGEPGFRSSYSLHGFPAEGGFYPGNPDSFDRLRKKIPTSMGWCRICKVDCETVEGLDMHSQTREHQQMTMDMVISIKKQNAKRQKTSKDHSSVEEGNRSRNAGNKGRGKKT